MMKLEKRICVAVVVVVVRSDLCCHVAVVADHRLRIPDDSVVSRGSVSDSTYILSYICMRGNRRTKNTFVAVKSRSLTESDRWRIPAANPRAFSPPRDRPSWRQASPGPPTWTRPCSPLSRRIRGIPANGGESAREGHPRHLFLAGNLYRGS